MIYQIYYGDLNSRKVLFDIEYYITCSDEPNDMGYDNKWYLELDSYPFISNAVFFIRTLKPEQLEEFSKDCKELEELRGCIWEKHGNRCRTLQEAEKDKKEWGVYIEDTIKKFCDKYGLFLNID